MLTTLGISDWVTAAIVTWLAVQLPLGIAIGFCLRRVNALSAPQPVEAPAYATSDLTGWRELPSVALSALR